MNGDQIRLKHVLINLVKNALKNTSRGKITIYAGYSRSQSQLIIHIVDTGRGIKKEELPELFYLYGKLKRTAEINSDGLGMGLMISKKVVELNKGQIMLDSEGEGKGATAAFSFFSTLDKSDNQS